MDSPLQVQLEPWPSGDSQHLLVLRFSPEEITSRYQLAFVEDHDDLDWLQLTTVRLGDGSQVLLERHRGDPIPGVIAHIDSKANFSQAKMLLMETLDLSEEDVLWTSPRVEGFEEEEE